MKDLIKKILKEETQDEFILEIPNLLFIPGADLETPEGMTDAWNELLRLLNGKPFIFDDDLDLTDTDITSLGNLQSVNGDLDLENCKNLNSLGNLQSVGDYLDLSRTDITSLGNLKSVGSYLSLYKTNVTSLGNLEFVGESLFLKETPISKKYSEEEIRQMVNVVGRVIL